MECAEGGYELGWNSTIIDGIPSALFEDQMRRHEVLPGVTGWTQVNGRNALSWEEVQAGCLVYHQSFWLDLKILLMTVKKVLVREGIAAKEMQRCLYLQVAV